LSKTAVSFDRSAMSAEEFLGRLERGEGALGMLSKDDSLYVNANQAAQNLSKAAEALMRLTEDIRRDPKRYINLKIF
jgi:phospholipid/cholesterol/gamma-HCH transport system substrate-binding protein